MRKKITITLFILLSIPIFVALIGFLWPENRMIPVKGATTTSWNAKSFWAEPWGSSRTHKGIDIFAKKGTDLLATTDGIVISLGHWKKAGKHIFILGPKWKMHYYAHLDSITIERYTFVKSGQKIGTVGDSGNAKGKPPHLHYTIATLYPRPWAATNETHGNRKMYYIDPNIYLRE